MGNFLPGYKRRPGQLQMAEAVVKAIKDSGNLVVEGGTGIGKSMAYLIPALLSVINEGARVLVATSHKPLQDQIAKKDGPLVNTLLQARGLGPFSFVTLKGTSNYLCWQSAENERGKLVISDLAQKTIRYAEGENNKFSGDFEDFPFNLPPETRSQLSADNEDCLGNRCPHRDRCFALKIRRKAETADLVVTNHSLLSLDIRNEGAVIPGHFNTYIIDEGHNFEENATRANGLQTTLGACRRFLNNEIVRKAAVANSHRYLYAQEKLEQFQTGLNGLFARVGGGKFQDLEDENKVVLKSELTVGQDLAAALKELLIILKDLIPRTEEEAARSQRAQRQGAALVERLEKICAVSDPNLVYFVERSGGTGYSTNRGGGPSMSYTLTALPVDVSGYLEKWFTENNVVVTSATLSDGQNFNFFNSRVGLQHPATLIVPSPFNFKEQVALFLPRLPQALPGQGWKPLADSIEQLLRVAPGRALVLFTSHAALEGVWRSLAGPAINGVTELRNFPGRPIFKQGESQMTRIITEFQGTEMGIIFGTRSWWQGVDLPGMRMVIMDKLPFPQLNDPVVKARSEQIEENGGNSFLEFMLPSAIITFRQGFGRLMRKEDDYGVVVACDERITLKSYGRRFLKSLPDVVVLENLQKVEQFL